MFEGHVSPVHISSLAVDEPLDLDALHKKLCLRRETLSTREAGDGLEIGQLFFSREEEDGEWTAVLYRRLATLVSWTTSRWLDMVK